MVELAVFASEIVNILGLQEAIKTSTEGGRALLRNLECQVHKRRLVRLVLIVAELAFDLGLHLAFERKPILIIDLVQLRVDDGREAILRPIVKSNPKLPRAFLTIDLWTWLVEARTRGRSIQEPVGPLPCLHTGMVLLAQPLCDNLQEFLSVLLIPANTHPEGILERMQKRTRSDGLLVDRTLIQPIQHFLQCSCNSPLL